MPTSRSIMISGFMVFALAAPAFAENVSNAQTKPDGPPGQGLDQMLYKGLVGNVLDTVPMDPARRVGLQRANAVVSSTLSGRSLSTLAKLTHPALLIGGIAWGLWAASNINPPVTGAAESVNEDHKSSTENLPDAKSADKESLAASSSFVSMDFNPAPVTTPVPVESGVPMTPRPRVIKIWLSQPSN